MNTTATFTQEIDVRARTHAADRTVLVERMDALKAEVDAITRRRLPGIKSAANKAAQSGAELSACIERNPEMFTKPRTITLHGIKLGFQKGKGRITWASADKVCKLIRKQLPDEADSLIQTKETPIKTALLNLDIATLKKLGCNVEESGDQILIKDATGDLDKLVAKILVDHSQANDGEEQS